MRTNIVLDDELIAEAIRLTGIKTKKDVVHCALSELVAARSQKNLFELKGKIKFADNYDYKDSRRSG